jgi:phage-related baseplate assembly protein
MSSVDFSLLVKPDMIEVIDFETLFTERKDELIALWPTTEQDAIRITLSRESEPLTKLLQENCYREIILRNRINQAALATLLAYAEKTDLDAVVANFGITRLIVTAATDTTDAVYETDEALRARASLVFDSLSVAGPISAYKYFALSADGRVSDVSVISPSPAYITVSLLQSDSENNAASEEVIDIVQQALNEDDVRPIGDRVTVQSASIIEYSIDADIYIEKDPEGATLLEKIQANVLAFATATNRIGKPIRLSQLYAQMHIDGVNRVVLNGPTADIEITDEQASFCTSININLAGTA